MSSAFRLFLIAIGAGLAALFLFYMAARFGFYYLLTWIDGVHAP